jgi:hypothetical protein
MRQGSEGLGGLWQERGWIDGAPAVFGNRSVFAYIAMEFLHERRIAEAEWWLRHTAEALAEHRSGWDDDEEDDAEDGDVLQVEFDERRFVRRQVAWAKAVLGQLADENAAKPKAPAKVNYSDAEAAAYLDGLVDNGGKPLVPVRTDLRTMWDLIKNIPGRPAKNIAERGEKLRRQRGESA